MRNNSISKNLRKSNSEKKIPLKTNEEIINELFSEIYNIFEDIYKKNPEKSKQLEKYLKNKVKTFGNKMPFVHETFTKKIKNDKRYKLLETKDKFLLIIKLLCNEYLECKIISGDILKDIHMKISRNEVEKLIKLIEEKNIINEWASCDNLSGKFFKFYGLLSKENTLYIVNLNQSNNLWVRRISLVSFVNRIKYKDEKPNFKGFIDLMFDNINKNIIYQERFNQLAVGWLSRYLALVNYERFEKWIFLNYNKLSREAIRYSIEKLNSQQRKKILTYNFYENDK
jgi:hypothetical protein